MRILKSKLQFIILFLVALLASCTYEPVDGTVESNPGAGIFKADFSGKTWTASETQATISGSFIEISAIKSNGEGFAFMIEGADVGTYAANVNIFSFTPAGMEYGYWGINDDDVDEDTGSVTITAINTEKKTISGTFHFKGYWSDSDNPKTPITFSNGVFKDVPYSTQEETDDSFNAKVANVNFTATDIFTSVVSSGSSEWIGIGAKDASGNKISVSVKSSLTAGSYSITGNILTDKVQASYEYATDEYKAVSGTVIITSISADRIKGTFQFTTNGTTPFAITQGAFDVEY